jgi:hypothetical protein
MYVFTKLPVTLLGSILAIAVSRFLWKLVTHRRRFRDLVCTCSDFLFRHLYPYLTAPSAQTASQFSLWASRYIFQSYQASSRKPTFRRRSLPYPVSIQAS